MSLISCEELKQATGHTTNAAIAKCLRDQKIPFLYGKKGAIFTTTEALNQALGLQPINQKPEEIDFV